MFMRNGKMVYLQRDEIEVSVKLLRLTKKMKRAIQHTATAAVLALGAELSRRGYDVTFTMGNTPKIDMMGAVPDGKTFKIQVKGISNEAGFFVGEKFFEGDSQSDLFLVVVYVPKIHMHTHRGIDAARGLRVSIQ